MPEKAHYNLRHTSLFIIVIIYSSAIFRRATPLAPLTRRRQKRYQNVRLDRESCAITYGSGPSNHGDAVRKKR